MDEEIVIENEGQDQDNSGSTESTKPFVEPPVESEPATEESAPLKAEVRMSIDDLSKLEDGEFYLEGGAYFLKDGTPVKLI